MHFFYPDFFNGGMMDIANYNYGKKGSRIRLRTNIEIVNKETLKISTVPYGITTGSLIDSIISGLLTPTLWPV